MGVGSGSGLGAGGGGGVGGGGAGGVTLGGFGLEGKHISLLKYVVETTRRLTVVQIDT